jgi:hypothetical protein
MSREATAALSRIEEYTNSHSAGTPESERALMHLVVKHVQTIDALKAALENTERVLHDWLTGRPQHIHELVAHELAAIRQVLKKSGA